MGLSRSEWSPEEIGPPNQFLQSNLSPQDQLLLKERDRLLKELVPLAQKQIFIRDMSTYILYFWRKGSLLEDMVPLGKQNTNKGNTPPPLLPSCSRTDCVLFS